MHKLWLKMRWLIVLGLLAWVPLAGRVNDFLRECYVSAGGFISVDGLVPCSPGGTITPECRWGTVIFLIDMSGVCALLLAVGLGCLWLPEHQRNYEERFARRNRPR